ncbi:MAG: hypothetical protein ACRCYY_12865 [Trueperaceae bacterium]
MSKAIRKLASLDKDEAEIQARLAEIRHQKKLELEALRSEQVRVLGEAALAALESKILPPTFLDSLKLSRQNVALFSNLKTQSSSGELSKAEAKVG